jgi:hypothetical protein
MGNGSTADVGHVTNPNADTSNICDAGICGAMAEQRRPDGWSENESVPQQFVHLVGCRDPNSRRAPYPMTQSVRPRPAPPKP